MSTQSTEESFCGDTLMKFGENYAHNAHDYVNMSVGVIGAIFNLLNLLVFTRKNMRSPANTIFTQLALVDLMISLLSITTSWIEFFIYFDKDYEKWTYKLALAVIFICEFTSTLFHISTFLTMMLVVWRYIAIVYPLKVRHWCNMKTTRNVLIIGYIVCVLLRMPNYFKWDIVTHYNLYFPEQKQILSRLHIIASNITGTLYSLALMAVQIIFTPRLIVALISNKKHQEQLTQSSSNENNINNLRKKQQTDRSILILLIVMTLHLISGIPTLIFYSVEAFHSKMNQNDVRCMNYLGLILNSFLLISICTFTFIVYYTMSENFRTTFKSLFNKNYISLQKDTALALNNRRKIDTDPEIDQVQ